MKPWLSRRRWLLVAAVALPAGFASAPAASATWMAAGGGSAGAAGSVMPTGTAPTGSVVRQSVTVSWSPAAFPNGPDVAGYVITRFDALNGAPATVGAGCSGVVTTTSCTEQSVPAGTWIYEDTPVQLSWTGGTSPPSGAVTVLPT